ncbi:MAG: hypothetical protein ACYTCU_10475 [Planctomycetota bacterium]|jgi:hypothetical protein
MGLAESDPTETRGRRTAPIALGAWLLGFVIVAAAGNALTPWPDDFAVTPKVEYLREHAAEIDTIYIGRSHVFRSFIPEVIDARLAEAGIDMRSFNLGGPGMSDAEIDHVLRSVLAIEGLELDYVFIEVPDWVSFTEDNLDTNRAVNWHTLLQTRRVLRAQFLAIDTWVERAKAGWPHVELAWLRATAYGQGKRIAASLMGVEEEHPLSPEGVAAHLGYQMLDDIDTDEMRRRRAAFVRNRAGYPDRVKGIMDGNREPYDLEHYDFDALDQQIEAIRAAGARPVYIVAPSMHPAPYAGALDEQGRIPDLMVFNEPGEYPLIYRYDRRFDGHLNRQGAREFSLGFAERLIGFLDGAR